MTPTLTPAEIEQMIRGFSDHQKFCSHLQIRSKDGITVPYLSSPGGMKLDASIRKQERAGRPVRQVVLKASQVWMSSSVATQVFRRIAFFPGRRALVVADTQDHANLVFEYYEQYIKSYTDNPYGSEWGCAVKLPGMVKDTEQWLRWANESSILVGTANNVDIGRSAPYNWAHLSEAAFYRSLGGLMTGLMQRIPLSADSGVVIESTANGMGGDFYDLCQLAMGGRTGWAFVFFAWWEHPENQMDPAMLGFSDLAAFQKSLTKDEWTEQQAYNLNLRQLAWRRHKIDTDCEGRLGRFQQEHPANPQEAFQSSGRTIFDMQALSRMPVIQEPTRGRLEVVEVGIEKRVQFLADTHGDLLVYRRPEKGKRYIIGADHAEGKDPKAKDGRSDPDYCSAQVLDADTGEQVAKWRERLEPAPWAQRLYWLAKWFNWAFLVPEQNSVGIAVITKLMELDYPLDLIYSQERDLTDRRPAELHQLGWRTDVRTRPILISNLDMAIRQMAVQIHDQNTVTECQTFVRKPNGREEGVDHDDDVIAAALAVSGLAKARRVFAWREQQEQDQHKQWRPTKYGRDVED